MGKVSFTIALLKPEIASGVYSFVPAPEKPLLQSSRSAAPHSSRGGDENSEDAQGDDPQDGDSSQALLRSSIVGVSAVEAALLYPDGQILTNVFARIAKAGFVIRSKRMVQLTKAQVRSLYSHEAARLKDEAKFREYLDHFTSGPSLALLLEYPEATNTTDAISQWKALVGAENSVLARQEALSSSLPHDEWPLHALCGLNAVQNGIQSSANLDCFHRERALLFPAVEQRLENAIIAVLPSFLSALPEGKALLLWKLSTNGVLVSKTVENYKFASRKELALLAKELHPVTNEQHRSEFMQCLEQAVGMKNDDDSSSSCCCLLEVDALDLSTKLRNILGPASIEDAHLYFPDSVRAQLPTSLLPTPTPSLMNNVRTTENDTTFLESGLFVSFDPRTMSTLTHHTPGSERIEQTFAIIKPGTASDPLAVREIQTAIRAFGFTIEAQRRLLLTRAQAATFYGEHRGKAFFERLLVFMTSGEIVAMRLARRNAIAAWRGLMGPTNALKARETHPWTLRARFGIDGTRNATHGSDAPGSAQRELKFFFSGGLQAFASDDKAVNGSKAMAQRALPSPYPPNLTLEKVLIQALDEMLDFEVPTQLDACSWLGNWLIEYSQRQQLKQDESVKRETTADLSGASRIKARSQTKPSKNQRVVAPVDSMEQLFGSNRSIVAVSYASDVSAQLRMAVSDALCSSVSPRFLCVDVAALLQQHKGDIQSAVAALVTQMKAAGKRRFLLHDFETSSQALVQAFNAQLEWRINSAVTMSCSGGTPAKITSSALDPMVPHLFYHLQQPFKAASDLSFRHFCSAVFEPTLVVVFDVKELVEVSKWRAIAQHFGLSLLAFDDLINARIAKERDVNGVVTQLVRTRAKLPRELLLALVSDVVRNFQPARARDNAEQLGVAQKFLLCGFPFAEALPTEFEKHVGSIHRLLHVQAKPDHEHSTALGLKKDSASVIMNGWLAHARERGTVTNLWIDGATSSSSLRQSHRLSDELRTDCALSFGPVVGFCIGIGEREEQLAQIRREAQALGFIWLDVAQLVKSKRPEQKDDIASFVARLKWLLLRANAGREKFLLHGFPLSQAALVAFMESVCVPRFVLLSTLGKEASSNSALQSCLATLDEIPQIIQLDIASSSDRDSSSSNTGSLAHLQSVLFGKTVSFLVGDTADINSERLQSAVAPQGFCVLDLRKCRKIPQQECPSEVDTLSDTDVHRHVQNLLSCLQATATPRCLVIGAPEHLSFFQALQSAVGTAVDKIVLLKHVERQAPPRGSKRDDSEDYYSDDDEELERQRQLKARAALPTHLDELLQFYGSKQQQSHSSGSGSSRGSAAGALVVSRVAFCDLDAKVYAVVKRQLLPLIVGVVSNPHTFYTSALSALAKRHAISLVVQSWWRSDGDDEYGDMAAQLAQRVTMLQHLVARTPFAIYLVDAFPRLTGDVAPYISQQLSALERDVAPMAVLVHFVASMDVLVERKPDGMTRNMLEDAQDALEAQTGELLACFSGASSSSSGGQQQKRKMLSVTCERELVDAQEELEDALLRAGVLR